jgi:AraC-like DNA-binding protein
MLQSLILKLIYFLTEYSSHGSGRHTPKHSNSVISKTVEYIANNLTADLSLNTISKSFNFTPVYFHKLFKSSTGKTLRTYVEEQRIKKAIELLLSTEDTLTQIAYACGFSSQSYFSNAFKKKMNCTPREYVKKIHLRYEKSQ